MCNLGKTAFLSDTVYEKLLCSGIFLRQKAFSLTKMRKPFHPMDWRNHCFNVVPATLEMFGRKFTFRERLILKVFYKVRKLECRIFQKRML